VQVLVTIVVVAAVVVETVVVTVVVVKTVVVTVETEVEVLLDTVEVDDDEVDDFVPSESSANLMANGEARPFVHPKMTVFPMMSGEAVPEKSLSESTSLLESATGGLHETPRLTDWM
jgi:hypothetical protein